MYTKITTGQNPTVTILGMRNQEMRTLQLLTFRAESAFQVASMIVHEIHFLFENMDEQ